MATKSFLKNIVIKNKKNAASFASALENAEKKGRKKVDIKERARTISDTDTIKKIFGENKNDI